MAILRNANISISTSGDQTAITAVTGSTIKVWRAVLINGVATAQTVIVKDAAGGNTLGTFPLASAIGGGVNLGAGDMSHAPVWVTAAGGALTFNLSASTALSGELWYTQEGP